MNEISNEALRTAMKRVAIDNMAAGFLLEILLNRWLAPMTSADRAEQVADLLKAAAESKDFGTDENDELCVLLSDIAVEVRPAVARYLSRALQRTLVDR